jgi:hypothetical protein
MVRGSSDPPSSAHDVLARGLCRRYRDRNAEFVARILVLHRVSPTGRPHGTSDKHRKVIAATVASKRPNQKKSSGRLVNETGQEGRIVDVPLFRIRDHHLRLAREVFLPVQRHAMHADRRRCTGVYETRNETAQIELPLVVTSGGHALPCMPRVPPADAGCWLRPGPLSGHCMAWCLEARKRLERGVRGAETAL